MVQRTANEVRIWIVGVDILVYRIRHSLVNLWKKFVFPPNLISCHFSRNEFILPAVVSAKIIRYTFLRRHTQILKKVDNLTFAMPKFSSTNSNSVDVFMRKRKSNSQDEKHARVIRYDSSITYSIKVMSKTEDIFKLIYAWLHILSFKHFQRTWQSQ